jgi:hypothetical protein
MRDGVLGRLAAIFERETEEMSEGVGGICGCGAERGKGWVVYIERKLFFFFWNNMGKGKITRGSLLFLIGMEEKRGRERGKCFQVPRVSWREPNLQDNVL